MSRSYKKFPIVRQEKKDYRYLNRQFRHDKLLKVPSGGAYRRHKLHCWSWKYIWTIEQAIREYKEDETINQKYSYDEWIELWKKDVYRK